MIALRKAEVDDAEAIARVHVDAWRTTYDGLVPASHLNALSYEGRTERWLELLNRPDQYTFVAEAASGAVVGYVDGGPERTGRLGFAGELYSIYLLQDYRGQGIGTRLFVCLVRALRDASLNDLAVWVLEGNRYRGFYESLGGLRICDQEITIGGGRLVEVAYGWSELELRRFLGCGDR
jgi:GNAT superfamily N-acetyltransferase